MYKWMNEQSLLFQMREGTAAEWDRRGPLQTLKRLQYITLNSTKVNQYVLYSYWDLEGFSLYRW